MKLVARAFGLITLTALGCNTGAPAEPREDESTDEVQQNLLTNNIEIVSMASLRCLDLESHSIGENGAKVQQWECHGGPNQRWTLEDAGEGTYEIVSMASRKCLDLENHGLSENGTKVQQWGCYGGTNQRWTLEDAGEGTYEIVSMASRKCLDLESHGLSENGTKVQQWECYGGTNQRWILR